MAESTGSRLDRIETKLDQLTDAMITLARAEEKIIGLQEDHNKMHERLNKHSEKLDDVIIVGDDAIPSALASLKNGELNATIDGNTDLVGYEAVMAAYKVVTEGAKLEDWIVVSSSIMTVSDVTDEYLAGRDIELD